MGARCQGRREPGCALALGVLPVHAYGQTVGSAWRHAAAPPLSAAERAHLLGSNRRRSAATTPSTSNASTPQLSPRNSPQKHGSATATASAADRGKEADAAVSAGASTSVGAGDVAAGAATASVTARSGRQKKRVPRLKPVAVPRLRRLPSSLIASLSRTLLRSLPQRRLRRVPLQLAAAHRVVRRRQTLARRCWRPWASQPLRR